MAHRRPGEDPENFFPTPPWGGRALGEIVQALDPFPGAPAVVTRGAPDPTRAGWTCWEPACGAGHLAHGLRPYFRSVRQSDAYVYDGNAIVDFLSPAVVARNAPDPTRADWIVTNPPFDLITPFVETAWTLAGRGVAMLMRAAALEGETRWAAIQRDLPLTVFAPFVERLPMGRGRWDPKLSSAAHYAWFIWLKPQLRPQRFMARVGGAWRAATWPIPPGTRDRLTWPEDAADWGVR